MLSSTPVRGRNKGGFPNLRTIGSAARGASDFSQASRRRSGSNSASTNPAARNVRFARGVREIVAVENDFAVEHARAAV